MLQHDVLDHGYIRLVSHTMPAEWFTGGSGGYWTGDLEIVRAARVSYNADWRGTNASVHPEQQNKDEKLIHSLWKRRHTSPFEAMTFSFEVQAPIFVFRQWHRHRTQSYSEVSARYTELPDLFYIPKPTNVGWQDPKEKQARIMYSASSDINAVKIAAAADDFCSDLRVAVGRLHSLYSRFLERGIPREVARFFLPLNTYSRMYASANLLNWFRFIDLRNDVHAQYEIRVYAAAMLDLLAGVCPIAVEAFKRYKFKLEDTAPMEEDDAPSGSGPVKKG